MSEEVLLSTDWVDKHKQDSDVVIVESNEDPLVYRAGHIPGAIEIDWVKDLNDPIRRDYLDAESFSRLCSRCGISRETLVVFYGDRNNWWACYAFWVFSLFEHPRLALMDGGKLLWERQGRTLTKEKPSPPLRDYPLVPRNDRDNRAFRDDVFAHLKQQGSLVDVRTPDEFSGRLLHMPEYPNEGATRGGHIPGAKNIPWAKAIRSEDARFLSPAELQKLYCEEQGLSPLETQIAYCRIGERSSHTWFVLKHLLGFSNVKNYDGSWTEWGNLVGAPIAREMSGVTE